MKLFITTYLICFCCISKAQEKYYFPPELIKQNNIYKIRAYEMYTDSVRNKNKTELHYRCKYEEYTDIFFNNYGYRIKSQRYIASRNKINKLVYKPAEFNQYSDSIQDQYFNFYFSEAIINNSQYPKILYDTINQKLTIPYQNMYTYYIDVKEFNKNKTIKSERRYDYHTTRYNNCNSIYNYFLASDSIKNYLEYEIKYYYSNKTLDSIEYWQCDTNNGWSIWNKRKYILNRYSLPDYTTNSYKGRFDYYDKFVYFTKKRKK
jgi:hypothetical protein